MNFAGLHWISSQCIAIGIAMAFLFKGPKNKNWVAGFLDIRGKRRNRSTGSTNRREAQRIADSYEDAARKRRTIRQVREVISELHESVTGEELQELSVKDFVTSWLKRKAPETADSTLKFYKGSTKKFVDFLGERKTLNLSEVTQAEILNFRNELAQTLLAKTVNHDLKCLKMLFKAAKREGLISEDPTEFVDTVKDRSEGQPTRRPFTVAELEATMEAADGEWPSMVMIGLYTGQRIGDIATLLRKNIDLEKGMLRFITKKTKRKMAIPLAPPLLEFLRGLQLPKNPEGPIHPKAHEILTVQKKSSLLSNQFARVLVKAGIREKKSHKSTGKGRNAKRSYHPLSFHSLRHTATTMLHEAGVPPSVAQAMIGHDSEAIHQIYVSIGDAALKEAASALPRIGLAS